MNRSRLLACAAGGALGVAAPVFADWIFRYADPAEVTLNQRFSAVVDFTFMTDETPIVAVVNSTEQPMRVRSVHVLVSRYIGIGDTALDDWYLTFRESAEAVEGATEWDGDGRVFHIGPPTSWSNFPGATDREGHPVQDTRLADLDRFNMIVPAHSTRYLGVGNAVGPDNGFTFVMLTDRHIGADDYGFTSIFDPCSRTIAEITDGQNEEYANVAINVELVPVLKPPPAKVGPPQRVEPK